jgi:lysophospholipase L1-like esterase
LTGRLRTDGKTVTLQNLGLPGGVLGPEIQGIGNQLGRGILTNFLDSEMPFVDRTATLVTVFAGGNDVNTVGAALEAGYGGSNPDAYLAARAANFGSDLRTLVNGIKGRAPSARIVVLNLPNLAALPYAAGYTLAQRRALQQIAVAFSARINALTADGAIVVDIMCQSEFYDPASYSSDGFHPNDLGYQRMADVIYPAASTGSAAPPPATCSRMTIY